MMRLFHAPASPFVRKVMVVLHESGLLDRTEIVTVSGNPTDPGTMPVASNPLGKIPALVLEDGRSLFDSRVICRYLDDRAGCGLYPKGDVLWDVLTTEAVADGMMEAAVLMVYESRLRPESARHFPWIEGQWAKIMRAAADLETRRMAQLEGAFGMAQVAVACALDYVSFRLPERDWRAGHPGLAAWLSGVSARPSLAATLPRA